MSFCYRFALMAQIPPSAPSEFVAWVESCIAGESPAPQFEVPPVAERFVEDAAWLLGEAGTLTGHPTSRGTTWGLSVLISNLHDDLQAPMYGLPFLVAPHCEDGMIATWWTDTGDVDPTLVFVQDGVAYFGSRNGVPTAGVDSGEEAPVWRLGIDRATVEECDRLGLADQERLVREEESGEPALARAVLARSIVRAVRDVDLSGLAGDDEVTESERDRLRSAVDLGARLALELVDAGGDPALAGRTPGWQLQEVAANVRTRGGVSGSGRVIAGIVDRLDDVDPGSLDGGPKRLVEGDVLTAIVPFSLTASSWVRKTDESGRLLGSRTHRLDVDVPAGSQLELTKVYDAGHAQCRPVEGDFFAWIRSGEPVAAATEYTLAAIHPEDEGRLFRRTSSPP